MKEKKIELDALVGLLHHANEAAKDYAHIDDGGTCNLDCVLIKLDGYTESEIEHVMELSGIDIGDKHHGGLWKNYRSVDFVSSGQGMRRSKMAEAAYKVLDKGVTGLPGVGIEAMLWQQSD